jgi:hypothetical protein
MSASHDKNDEELPGMLAVAKGIAEQRFPHTMDAAVWASEFMKIHAGMTDLDEGAMIGWFANAIMAGYDAAQARAASAIERAPRADWYCEHTEAEVRRRYQSDTDHDAPAHMRGESFEKWAEAEGYIRGDALLNRIHDALLAPSTVATFDEWWRGVGNEEVCTFKFGEEK